MSSNHNAIQTIADAYIYGFPLILMNATQQSDGDLNSLYSMTELGDSNNKAVVRENLDTLYVQGWFDLSESPQVVRMPVTHNRYWHLQMMDAWSNTVHDPGSAHPQASEQDGYFTYILTGPKDTIKADNGATVLQFTTNIIWLLGRIELKELGEISEVRKIQDAVRVLSYDEWNNSGEGMAPAHLTFANLVGSPAADVRNLSPEDFFHRLTDLGKKPSFSS